MTRIEGFSASGKVPVEQAQLIDPGAFRLSTAGAEALGQVGGVLKELGKRKIDMQDRIGISNINAAFEDAEREYQKEILTAPIEKHAEILQKHRNNAISFADQQNLSDRTRELAQNKVKIWGDTFSDAGEIATIRALEKDALIAVTTDYEKALTEEDAVNIEEKEKAFDAQAKISYTPAEAKEIKARIHERAIIGMEKNAVNAVHEAIESKNFGIAKALAESPSIPAQSRILLKNKIKAAEREVDELVLEQDRDKLGKALNDGTINFALIDDTSLPEAEQEKYRIRMNTEAQRRAKGEPIVTNQSIKGDIEQEAYKIWMGAIGQNEYVDILENARYGVKKDGKFQFSFGDIADDKPLIDDAAFDELRTLGIKELKQSQAKGLSESSFYAKGQLVEIPEDDIFNLSVVDFSAKQKKIAISERQFQLENWSQFNRSMKLWQADNPDAVEGDYYIESRRKLPFYRGRAEESISTGELPSDKEQIVGPLQSPSDLRKLNTKEAYEKGRKLGYWE